MDEVEVQNKNGRSFRSCRRVIPHYVDMRNLLLAFKRRCSAQFFTGHINAQFLIIRIA